MRALSSSRVLLFKKPFWEGLVSGAITLTFRRWKSAHVKVGGRYRCHPIGVLEVDGTELNEFREKPQLAYLANMGIYVLSRTVLDQLDGDGAHGVDELIRSLLAAGVHPNVYEFDGYWLDIGRPEDYDRANLEFAELRRQLLGDEVDTPDSTIDLRPLRPDPHPDAVPLDAIVGSVA